MRPLRVELQGFSTFREPTEIDFGDTDLLAFVGPTGSGKSSIIDAITFALYGSVARYDDARLVAPVISQGANEARVRLDFELGSRTYVAVRIVRRTKTGATTKEARLELLDATEGESPVLATGAKELTEAVEALLGLDFSQFTRTVVLPQGDFAEFLKDDPASRQRLLRRLLDLEIYSRMGARARQLASAAEQQAEVYQNQLAQYTDLTPATLAEQQTAASALSKFSTAVNGQLGAIDEVEGRLETLRLAVGVIDASIQALSGVGLPAEVSVEMGRVEDLRAQLEAERALLAEARAARTAARSAMADAGEPRQLQTFLDAHARLEAVSAELEDLIAQHRDAVEEAKLAIGHHGKVVAQLEEAQLRRESARAGAKAADWVSSLVVGDPCPVCRQTVIDLPAHDPVAELAEADAAWVEASEEQRLSDAQMAAAKSKADRLEARADERRTTCQTLADSLVKAPDEIEARLVEAVAAADTAADAEQKLTAVETSVRKAEDAVVSAEAAERELRQAFTVQRDGVAALGPPLVVGSSLLDDWRALQTWATERGRLLEEERVSVAAQGKATAAEKAEKVDGLLAEASRFGLDVPIADLPHVLARSQADAEGRIERTKARLEDIAGWRDELSARNETKAVNETLGRHLSATGFERWLLAEALDDLVARATLQLKELSGGQYSLTAEESVFKIIDHRNADEPRDVRTLSGGETFLASLALALALADSIADLAPVDAPRLGSMFLDEGFGTLDAETLDVVASAIEDLSASGRLVGIVTHIEALAERMPVQIVVNKGPTTSTVARVTR